MWGLGRVCTHTAHICTPMADGGCVSCARYYGGGEESKSAPDQFTEFNLANLREPPRADDTGFSVGLEATELLKWRAGQLV